MIVDLFVIMETLTAALSAFLGGMILNLMPCVLPVLSLKLMSFAKQHKKESSFMNSLSYTAGILFSFWILAFVLMTLRAGGEKIGWGFQFQSPHFLSVLTIFMVLVSLNFFGVFEIGTGLISLSAKTNSINNSTIYSPAANESKESVSDNTKDQSAGKTEYLSSFMSGLLAVLVAAPCAAPFMGSAVGFALLSSPVVSFIIFTFLGLGLAFPFVLLSIFPSLLKFMPKPGVWMDKLKQFFAFPMLATAIWLFWLFSELTTPWASAVLLFSILIASLAVWIYGSFATFTSRYRILFSTISVFILLISFASAYYISGEKKSVKIQGETLSDNKVIPWKKFSPALLEQELKENRAIFIDFTADWCLSCKVNEKVAIEREEFKLLLEEKNVLALKADWTEPDAEIEKILSQYQRSSVPFYLLFDKSGKAHILPEILTPEILKEYMNKI